MVCSKTDIFWEKQFYLIIYMTFLRSIYEVKTLLQLLQIVGYLEVSVGLQEFWRSTRFKGEKDNKTMF